MYCIVTVVRFVIILIKFYVCMYGEFNCYKPSFKNMLHNDPMKLCVHAVEIRFQIKIHKSRNITKSADVKMHRPTGAIKSNQ